MSKVLGWYYLHINKDLIFKSGSEAVLDMRESDFCHTCWPVIVEDREGAWSILVEALSLGATTKRIKELAEKWHCDDDDAKVYAERIGVVLGMDGNQNTATTGNYINMVESPCGFGNNYLEAMADLCKQLGYKGGKMWATTFKDLLKGK